ncbi:hypothetical protein ADL22_21320 [Streptomyces sp. NRRL F-4489]|uniref:hypothetical protein n=1 Tax=Streptomyces sp. NRRL F-4489 TaxID=1609095 RepID=UPI000748057C|nr:hypothetical protein [Streptomyces sp. NRRL F-4489]KUL37500.1 hypothetical protein ADL22_21320 [Streptomyces sp. NRRL F-4489]
MPPRPPITGPGPTEAAAISAPLDAPVQLIPIPYPACRICVAAAKCAKASSVPETKARFYRVIAQHPHRRAGDVRCAA